MPKDGCCSTTKKECVYMLNGCAYPQFCHDGCKGRPYKAPDIDSVWLAEQMVKQDSYAARRRVHTERMLGHLSSDATKQD